MLPLFLPSAENPPISSDAIEKMLESGMSTIEMAILEIKPIDEADFRKLFIFPCLVLVAREVLYQKVSSVEAQMKELTKKL